MSAKDTFEKLAPAYRKAYEEANGHMIKSLEFKGGWVIINGTTKCRAKELQKFTETLNKRIENDKNKKPEEPIFNIKTKIKFVKENKQSSFYTDFTKVFLGEFPLAYYFKNKLNYETDMYIIMPLVPVENYKKNWVTEDEAIDECERIANNIINRINDI